MFCFISSGTIVDYLWRVILLRENINRRNLQANIKFSTILVWCRHTNWIGIWSFAHVHISQRDLGILKIDDQCLEIFGRYLLPNTVTVGNQCLIFQDKDVFFVSKLDTYTLFTRANLLVEYQGQSN